MEVLDLTNENDYKKYNELIDTLESMMPDCNSIMSFFGFNNDICNKFREIGKIIHDTNEKYEESNLIKNNNKTVIDKEITTNNAVTKKEIPSSNIKNIDVKMQIHRLTQEYIDTMMKPYLKKSEKTTKDLNNAYTALFEFACWIYNK